MCVSLCLRLRLPWYDDQRADLSWWAHRGIWSRPRHSDSPLQTTPTGKRDLHQPYRYSPRWHKENHKPNIVNLSFIICHTLCMSLCPCGCFGFFFFQPPSLPGLEDCSTGQSWTTTQSCRGSAKLWRPCALRPLRLVTWPRIWPSASKAFRS